MKLSREPILSGEIYCSPDCGFKCTKAAYDNAVKEADLLAARMGFGWTPRVWENMGWYYNVSKGVATVSPSGTKDGYYWISINATHQVIHADTDPVQGFETALGLLRLKIDDLQNTLDELRGS